jgi:hypothetical protein
MLILSPSNLFIKVVRQVVNKFLINVCSYYAEHWALRNILFFFPRDDKIDRVGLHYSMCECAYMQGWTGHITRWEKSHEAPLDWEPLRQSEAHQHHDLFFFFLGQQFRFCSKFFFWGPLKKNPTKIWGAM